MTGRGRLVLRTMCVRESREFPGAGAGCSWSFFVNGDLTWGNYIGGYEGICIPSL